jgi:hypothetical protein
MVHQVGFMTRHSQRWEIRDLLNTTVVPNISGQ